MRFAERPALDALLAELARRGYDLVGPVVRDGAIVLDRIEGAGELPIGVREAQRPGGYVLERDPEDPRRFAFAHGPDSAKRFLFPAREVLTRITRTGGSINVEPDDEAERPMAFIGLRACDLRAIAVQDRVFGHGPEPDRRYERRRAAAFVVAVDCAEPGGTCFCASMGTGPRCSEGFDLAITEIGQGLLVRVGTSRGAEVLDAVGSREATADELAEGERIAERASARMGRTLDTSDLPAVLFRNREHPRWDEVAERCLACGNCTSVCPTCFCHDVVDASDLLGTEATRTREWASCFSVEFSHTAGGDVRSSPAARYRQWLTHKFAGWIDQFGTSGCVGCGRCITWCPVGIDITEELDAIRASDGAELVGAGAVR